MNQTHIQANFERIGPPWWEGDEICDICTNSLNDCHMYYMGFDGVGDILCGPCMKKELQKCIDIIDSGAE
jgi:hypothetical protein